MSPPLTNEQVHSDTSHYRIDDDPQIERDKDILKSLSGIPAKTVYNFLVFTWMYMHPK
ncbi:MAG: hypothetical protein IPO85_07135 [Saprospiraceae bacterium]|uniref:Uncharacterized protein n=1 Tax=Candidatus Defluviibacterium haderslevense TaxID=2981993 RepID=A0A9D7S8D3_9BACT|nr:hypothetical protein [Candidatus Defluviibacterium haderslevense]